MNKSILNSYKEINEEKINQLFINEFENNNCKIVVLDDDPTGVQTIHDLYVYTECSYESILAGFKEENKAFFLLTNSRGLSVKQTTDLHLSIKENVEKVSKELNIPYIMISRSDSTLRGHYPLETELLNVNYDGEILCPFFKEGGRFTINNIHYVLQNDELVEAADTEFAKDKTFGYQNSDLTKYIEEKTEGKYKAEDVTCISLDEIRNMDIDSIEAKLLAVNDFNKIIVNTIDYCDLKVFAIAYYRALSKGKRFIFRSAASIVRVLANVTPIDLLTREQMIQKDTTNGGIVVVGSHTAKTTAQLNKLLELENVVPIEFNSDKILLGKEEFYKEVDRCVALEEEIILSGKTAVCFTKRKLLSLENDTKEKALERSVAISDGVQKLVGLLKVQPAFVIAKGGITSSDVGTKALGVKKALVLGQILPSIPVWKTGEESKFSGIPYIIFPGNTGNEDSLKKAVSILSNVE